jgi:hypothetical protein
MLSVPGSSTSLNPRPQKRNNKWYSRTDLVTFDVFKREYWPHLAGGIGMSSAPASFTYAHSRPKAPSLAFSDFLGIVAGSRL